VSRRRDLGVHLRVDLTDITFRGASASRRNHEGTKTRR
jgi:hypothetical protein